MDPTARFISGILSRHNLFCKNLSINHPCGKKLSCKNSRSHFFYIILHHKINVYKKRDIMRKIIAFSFIACTLSSSTTFCMLKHVLRTQKYIRGYQTTPFFQLPPGNIFNTPKKDLTQEKTAAFLEDLWNRNGNFARLLDKQGTLLEKQNDIVVAYMSGHN